MEGIIDNLKIKKVIKTKKIAEILRKVNRLNYCMCSRIIDHPTPIIMGQTISAPHIHAMTLEALRNKLVPGAHVLDVGCGTGYLTSCFAYLLNVHKNPNSVVVGIDIFKEITELTKMNMIRGDKKVLSSIYGGLNNNNNVHIVHGNGWLGYDKYAPYDAINVGASVNVIPTQLIKQLKDGGKMIIPLNGDYLIIRKIKKNYKVKKISDVRFVPLILQTQKK